MAGYFYMGYYFIFSFFVFVSFAVSLLLNFGQVNRRTFVTFLWCYLERGGLLNFLVFLLLVIERCAVLVVIAWAARLGVGAIS
jgi:hypothetical protein